MNKQLNKNLFFSGSNFLKNYKKNFIFLKKYLFSLINEGKKKTFKIFYDLNYNNNFKNFLIHKYTCFNLYKNSYSSSKISYCFLSYSLLYFILNKFFILKKWSFFNSDFFLNKTYFKNNNFINKIKDITTNLFFNEILFESRSFTSNLFHPINTVGILLYQTHINKTIQNSFIFCLKQNKYYKITNISEFVIHEKSTTIISPSVYIYYGIHPVKILVKALFFNNLKYYSQYVSAKLSHIYMHNFIIEALSEQYFSGGINIPRLQFEILSQKMTNFVKINMVGDSSLSKNDIFELNYILTLNNALSFSNLLQLTYIPLVLGITKSLSISSSMFFSISFQEIFKHLERFSLQNSSDWLTDLKSKIISSDMITSGTGWYRKFII